MPLIKLNKWTIIIVTVISIAAFAAIMMAHRNFMTLDSCTTDDFTSDLPPWSIPIYLPITALEAAHNLLAPSTMPGLCGHTPGWLQLIEVLLQLAYVWALVYLAAAGLRALVSKRAV